LFKPFYATSRYNIIIKLYPHLEKHQPIIYQDFVFEKPPASISSLLASGFFIDANPQDNFWEKINTQKGKNPLSI
jgi:hypothetical protein